MEYCGNRKQINGVSLEKKLEWRPGIEYQATGPTCY